MISPENPSSELFGYIRKAVRNELYGDFPIARLNYFKIYNLCVKILKRITILEHPELWETDHICSCAREKLFTAAEDCVVNHRCYVEVEEYGLFRSFRQCFFDVMLDKPLTEYFFHMDETP